MAYINKSINGYTHVYTHMSIFITFTFTYAHINSFTVYKIHKIHFSMHLIKVIISTFTYLEWLHHNG